MKLHPAVEAVTQRIRARSAASRSAYLARLDAAAGRKPGAQRMGCANVAHAFAALPANDKFRVVAEKAPNIGIVEVYDPRLKMLSELSHSRKLVYATMQFVDIAGLVKGASQGEGLGNQFLSHIRETDAVMHVVRCFEDIDVTHV